MRKVFDDLLYSLPVQLVFLHLKKNLALLAVWILFLVVIFGGIGRVYGIHYLFLDPEYVHSVGFWSFFMIGLAYGNLVMSFHITSYILDGHKFTFIGVLERPFAKFSVNNSVIPLLTLLIYVGVIFWFQMSNEFVSFDRLVLDIAGLLLGVTGMCVLMFWYFKATNKDIFKFLAGSVDRRLKKSPISRGRVMLRFKESKQRKYSVTNYYDMRLRKRSTAQIENFYDKDAILKVFDQNHFNSVVIELAIIFLVILLGYFMENPYFQIPAAASCLLMLSIIVMLIGAVSYWFRGWGLAFILGLLVVANFLAKKGVIKGVYEARGLDYSGVGASYSLSHLEDLNSFTNYQKDYNHTISILESWKENQKEEKPRIIIQCISGGGQRAALWAVNALQQADKALDRTLMSRTVLMTGASGGLIGGAYFRELTLRRKMGADVDPLAHEHLVNIGKDNLNAIIFSLLVNDAFFRVRRYDYNGYSHLKDRGYMFEQNLNYNLEGVLDKRLVDYAQPEFDADIPMLFLSPVITNDGRKLYLSAQPVTYMSVSSEIGVNHGELKWRGVDFLRLFQDQGSTSLHFLSALRMSASFPYITPSITLPSQPPIEIMDAGISDNFGVADAHRFMYVFRDWIQENTSGVILLIIRDTRKVTPVEPRSNYSILDRFTYPIASVYNNLGNIQDIANDHKLEVADAWFKAPLEVIELEYNTYTIFDSPSSSQDDVGTERKEIERASLSWHLTEREKANIIANIELRDNQEELAKLKRLIQAPGGD